MKKENVSAMARANGVRPQTAWQRIYKGMSVEAATSTPAYGRRRTYRHGDKAQAVWTYLIKNPLARPCDVSRATGVSYGYVYRLMQKTGTPRAVFERELQQRTAAIVVDAVDGEFWELDTEDDSSPKLTAASIGLGFIITAVVFIVVVVALV